LWLDLATASALGGVFILLSHIRPLVVVGIVVAATARALYYRVSRSMPNRATIRAMARALVGHSCFLLSAGYDPGAPGTGGTALIQ
jgi:hypothetical protein